MHELELYDENSNGRGFYRYEQVPRFWKNKIYSSTFIIWNLIDILIKSY